MHLVKLWEDYMKFRFSLLVCGAFLIAAMPGWGDTIPYNRLGIGASEAASLTKTPGTPSIGLSAPVNAGTAAQPLSEALPIDAANAMKGFSAELGGLSLIGIASSDSHQSATLASDEVVMRHPIIDPDKHHDRHIHHHPAAVPEPGTLSLILIGLFSLGLLSSKRVRTSKNA